MVMGQVVFDMCTLYVCFEGWWWLKDLEIIQHYHLTST